MTSSTLIKSFERAKEDNRAALLTYTVGGDPDKKTSLNIFKSIAESGADIIECGLGHGANIGDGGAIQDSTYRALSGGIKTDDIFEIIEDFKKDYKTNGFLHFIIALFLGKYSMFFQKYLKALSQRGIMFLIHEPRFAQRYDQLKESQAQL